MRVYRYAADIGELSGRGSLLAPRLGEFAFFVELRDTRIAQAVSNEDVASGVPGDVSRPVEQVRGLPGAIPSCLAGGNVDCLRLAPKQHSYAALRIELHDHVGHLINHPDVVTRIDADLGGEHEAVTVLADLADELAVAVELEQSRAVVREGTRCADRDGGMAGPRVDKNIATRIRRHTAHLAEIEPGGKLQRFGDGIEANFRCFLLSGCGNNGNH